MLICFLKRGRGTARKVVDLGGREGGEDLGGLGEGKP